MSKCKYCETGLIEGAKFCHECSGVINEVDYEGSLGIHIDKDDVIEYVITGRLKKTIEIGKHIKVTIQTLTTGEEREMLTRIDTSTKGVSLVDVFTLEKKHALLAYAIVGLNGNIWPMDFDSKLETVQSLGSEIAAILAERCNMLHLAIGSKVQRLDF